MPVKASYLAIAGTGIILLWSGIRGKSWTTILRDVLTGKDPSKAPSSTPITGTPLSAFASYGMGGNTSTGGNAKVPVVGTSASQKAVISAIIVGLGAPPTAANVNSMAAWQAKEAPWNALGPDGAEYTHNPWNTTLKTAGSVGVVNSVGVQIYSNWATGIAATIATLRGYPNIVALLKSGNGLCGTTAGGDFSRWSGGGYSTVC